MILTCSTLCCNLIGNQNQNHMTISSLLKGGIQIGLKNFLSLVGALILYTLTIWVPYLNVGTTIAMVSIPAALSRGEIISPTEIFKSKYITTALLVILANIHSEVSAGTNSNCFFNNELVFMYDLPDWSG